MDRLSSEEAHMSWAWVIGGTWIAVGLAVATIIGRSIHVATVKGEEGSQEALVPTADILPPAGVIAIEQRSASIRRQNASPTGSASSPLVAGCVPPAERAPSEREHRVS
jgi:hypothetical protein